MDEAYEPNPAILDVVCGVQLEEKKVKKREPDFGTQFRWKSGIMLHTQGSRGYIADAVAALGSRMHW